MRKHRIVLDTNCLLASISSRSENFLVWKQFQQEKFTLCVSNEILEEYQEIIAAKTTPQVAQNIVRAITEADNVEFVNTYFSLNLITTDPDDNKFVDCAFAANATFVVSNDSHFDVLADIPFPKILVIRLKEFLNKLVEG